MLISDNKFIRIDSPKGAGRTISIRYRIFKDTSKTDCLYARRVYLLKAFRLLNAEIYFENVIPYGSLDR